MTQWIQHDCFLCLFSSQNCWGSIFLYFSGKHLPAPAGWAQGCYVATGMRRAGQLGPSVIVNLSSLGEKADTNSSPTRPNKHCCEFLVPWLHECLHLVFRYAVVASGLSVFPVQEQNINVLYAGRPYRPPGLAKITAFGKE